MESCGGWMDMGEQTPKDTESTLHEVLTQYLFFSNYILHVHSNFFNMDLF